MKAGFFVFALIGAFFLIMEHRAHVYPYLPWLLLAACPLMHLFMHRGHGGHGAHGGGARDERMVGSPGQVPDRVERPHSRGHDEGRS